MPGGTYEEDDYGEGMTMCPQCADRQAELERANERIDDLEDERDRLKGDIDQGADGMQRVIDELERLRIELLPG
jgi:archaellum component FlaC